MYTVELRKRKILSKYDKPITVINNAKAFEFIYESRLFVIIAESEHTYYHTDDFYSIKIMEDKDE